MNRAVSAATEVAPDTASPLAPFHHRAFAILWLAALVSNVGTWMNDVGTGWLMTTLSPSASTVALVQAATMLPVFLFALPAGALADIVDRRRLLLVVNVIMAGVAATMTVLVATAAMTASLLLVFSFLLGTGAAFLAPAWQAIVPSLVPRGDLPAAVSLNSVGINVSRAIGPALAGVLIVALGLWAPFLVNALSFVGILVALRLWPGEPKAADRLPPEALLPAMLAGLRFARRSPPLRRTILRAVPFFAFASAYWAMLPLVARDVLGGGSGLYGFLMGCVGAGAVAGAVALPWLRARVELNRVVLIGALATAAAMASLALIRIEALAAIAMLLAGAGWIAVLSSFQVSAQTALPGWVRGRGLSLFLTAFFGAMAAGAAFWGLLADLLGVAPTLGIAAAGLTLAAIVTLRIRLEPSDGSGLAASLHWPAPLAMPLAKADSGPVMVTVDYAVAAPHVPAFVNRIQALRDARLRDGGYGWQLYQPVEREDLLREVFFTASWLDHLRQHERVSRDDAVLQAELQSFCIDGQLPTVTHHLAASVDVRARAPAATT